jgi:NYN domain
VDRCALFVDAGYVLADGAMAVHGTRHRDSVSWDYAGLVKLLTGISRDRTGLPILRCYWYEATVEGRRSSEHNALADLPGVKLRMGRMRPGRREGVEAEMHRDLTTLARNHAVSDAVIVSAEEDLAEVVAEVQDFGLRVIIVHVAADGNWTVSRPLRQECDDIVEITAAHLRPFVDLIAGAEPSDRDDQYLNGSFQRHAMSNGHGPGYGGMTHQALPAAALPAPPAIYTGPLVDEYQRTAQPSGQGPLALSALAAAAAVGPPPHQHHPSATGRAPEPGAGPSATQPADQGSPGDQGPPQPQAAQPAQAQAAPPPLASPQAGSAQAAPPPGAPADQAGAQDPGSAQALVSQPLAAPAPAGYGAQPGDQISAPGGYAFAPGPGADDRRDVGGPVPDAAAPAAPGRHGAPAQPLAPQASVPQPPVPAPAAAQQNSFPHNGMAHNAAHQQAGPPNALPPRAVQQNSVPQDAVPQAPMPLDVMAQAPVPPTPGPQGQAPQAQVQPSPPNQGPTPQGAAQPGPIQHAAVPQGPVPQDPTAAAASQSSPRGPAEARFVPGQGDYGAPDQAGARGGMLARDGMAGLEAARPSAPLADAGMPGPYADPAASGPPGRFGEDSAPGRFADGSAPGRFADGPEQSRFGEGGGRFADGAAPARFGAGPGPARFGDGPGQQPYPPAPPGAFGAGSAAHVSYPQFPGPQPGQHASPGPDPGFAGPPHDQGPYSGPQPSAHAQLARPVPQPMAISLADAVQAAHAEGFGFGDAVARDAPALWLEAVLARKPRMPSDLEARLLQGSALPIDSLLHDEVRHSLRRGFWDALERSRR